MEVGSILEKIVNDLTEKYSLSQREAEVLKECIEGKSVKEMSSTIYLSRPAISYHANKLFKKMNVENRNQIIVRVIEWIAEQKNTS